MAVFEWKPEKRSPADVVSGLITANAAALVFASPRRMSRIFGRCTSGPCGGRKGGPQGRNGSVSPLELCQRGSITLYGGNAGVAGLEPNGGRKEEDTNQQSQRL